MQKSYLAVFLVILFMGTIGVMAMLSGSGMTGMAIFAKKSAVPIPSGNLNSACGTTCLRDIDCYGSCYKCSPSLWRCINPSKGMSGTYSYDAYVRCKYFCGVAAKQCYGGSFSLKNSKTCETNLQRCYTSCGYVNIPQGQPK